MDAEADAEVDPVDTPRPRAEAAMQLPQLEADTPEDLPEDRTPPPERNKSLESTSPITQPVFILGGDFMFVNTSNKDSIQKCLFNSMNVPVYLQIYPINSKQKL